jgi:hypothetical protein
VCDASKHEITQIKICLFPIGWSMMLPLKKGR